MQNSDDSPKLGEYDVELCSGIFNMVVLLCQTYEPAIGLDAAKDKVATWLESIASSLRVINEDTYKENKE